MRVRTQRLLITLTALSLTGAISLAAEPDDESVSDPQPGKQQPVRAADPVQMATFGILRRPAASEDRLPQPVADSIARSLSFDVGAAPGLARRAFRRGSGLSMYVLPARGWLCYYAVSDSGPVTGGCNRTDATTQGYNLGLENPAPGVTRITGLVPDGVTEVVLRGNDGAVERTTPEGNAYMFETTLSPKQVEFGGNVVPVFSPAEGLE